MPKRQLEISNEVAAELAGAVEHLRGNGRVEQDRVRRAKQLQLAQRQLARVVADRQLDPSRLRCGRTVGQPLRDLFRPRAGQRVEHPAFTERRVERKALLARRSA